MTKEISVFVDESGSFAPVTRDPHSPYYLLCMVFHDQSVDISKELERLADAFQGFCDFLPDFANTPLRD